MLSLFLQYVHSMTDGVYTKESFQTGFQGTITSRDLEQIQEKQIFNVYSAFFSVEKES